MGALGIIPSSSTARDESDRRVRALIALVLRIVTWSSDPTRGGHETCVGAIARHRCSRPATSIAERFLDGGSIVVGGANPKTWAEEGELGLTARMIAPRLPEAVVLAREEEYGVGDAALPERVDDPLRLAGGTTRSSTPCRIEDRARDPLRVSDRRASRYTLLRLRPRPDEPLEVARLELVGVLDEGSQVADPEVADAGLEDVAERERGERRVAARAAAPDRRAASRSTSPRSARNRRAGDAVVDVDDPPLALEPLRGSRGRSR